jgi:transposase
MGELDTVSLLFSLPDGICVSSVRSTTTEVVLQIACRRISAACPLCQQPSERVHGHYGRTVADLPCAGRRVIFALTVRKLVWCTPTCSRQMIRERGQQEVDALRHEQLLRENRQEVVLVPSKADAFGIVKGPRGFEVNRRRAVASECLLVLLVAALN